MTMQPNSPWCFVRRVVDARAGAARCSPPFLRATRSRHRPSWAGRCYRELNDLTASLSYEMDSGVTVEVWGRNLLNNRNLETIFDSVAQPGGISGYPNDPRTYGVTARFNW